MAIRGDVVPQIEVLPLESFQVAVEALKTSRTSGRIVLKMPVGVRGVEKN
jgi:D-arabinose 1-dehydrogenase-like Zn-dependent alcohol dehydrogenase